MPADLLGAPQIAALAVLAQRGLEEVYSARNARALLAGGAHEESRDYYPVVAVTHVAWIASVFLLIPRDAEVIWPLAAVYLLVLQPIRYWIVYTLGPYWTHKIVTRDEAPLVGAGPYRFLRHPNYILTAVEVCLLPLVFGAWALSLVITAIWIAVIRHKALLEERAIAARRTS